MASGDASKTDTGTNIILVGLVIQLVFFFLFIFLTMVFHSRTHEWGIEGGEGNWKRQLGVIELSSLLIFIRSIYRVVEYAQGFDGYLISHEVYLYILDALMMILVQILYNFLHPGAVLSEGGQETKKIEMGKNLCFEFFLLIFRLAYYHNKSKKSQKKSTPRRY